MTRSKEKNGLINTSSPSLRSSSLGSSSPPQHGKDEPPLPLAHVLDAAVPAPRPLGAVAVPLPDPLDLQPRGRQPLGGEEGARARPPRVEAADDPAPRRGALGEEPLDGAEQVVVLRGHPEAVARQHAVEGATVVVVVVRRCGGRREVAPRVARDLDVRRGGVARGEGRELRPDVPGDVRAEVGEHGRGGIVGDDDAARAQQGGQQRGEGGAGTQLDGGEVRDVEVRQGRAEGALERGRGAAR